MLPSILKRSTRLASTSSRSGGSISSSRSSLSFSTTSSSSSSSSSLRRPLASRSSSNSPHLSTSFSLSSRGYATPTNQPPKRDQKEKKESSSNKSAEVGDKKKDDPEFQAQIDKGLREAKEKSDPDPDPSSSVPNELKDFFDKKGIKSEGEKKASSNKSENKEESSEEKEKEEEKENKEKSKSKKNQIPPGATEIRLNGNTLLLTALSSYAVYRLTSSDSTSSREITWQEFRTALLDKGLVDRLEVVNRQRVKVHLHSNATGGMYQSSSSSDGGVTMSNGGSSNQSPRPTTSSGNNAYWFSVGSVEAFERKLDEAQRELGIPSNERIPVAYHDEVSASSTLLHFAPTILLAGLLFYMTRRAASGMGGAGGGGGGGGIFGVGKSKAKMFNQEEQVKTKFKHVAGMDEAKEEIMEFVNFLKNPAKYEKLGAKIPRGAILSGPPGTGKTLLAKATAGEAKVPFLSVSGSEFVEMVSHR